MCSGSLRLFEFSDIFNYTATDESCISVGFVENRQLVN